ncbi:MAG: class I tRNA ligase family protein [Spirochaetota bacterium]
MLRLFNSMTRSIEIFKPMDPKIVKIFSCGPSIYQQPHIGNYRTFLYEDLLLRYLEYSGYKVKRSIILTDVENKSISEAAKNKKTVSDLTDKAAEKFLMEAKLLKIKLPDPVPRSSTAIKQAAVLIKLLMEKGIAYRHKGDIFFDALKFRDFGKLFRLDMSRWPKQKRRFKKDTYNGRRWNLGDFILWHGYNEGDMAAWDTEIGRGWPSWNIQDPAVITKDLGYKIDINCGGIDNIYRHHDYTIAIIESISGSDYANYYLHGEHLIVNGKSMSKSRGNIIYPDDVFRKKYSPYHLRFFLLYRHYRKKSYFTWEKFNLTSAYIDSIRSLIQNILKKINIIRGIDTESSELIDMIKTEFKNNMDNDLDFNAAIDGVFLKLKKLNMIKDKRGLSLKSINTLEKILRDIDKATGVIF